MFGLSLNTIAVLCAIAGATASFGASRLWDTWIDDPRIAKAARAEGAAGERAIWEAEQTRIRAERAAERKKAEELVAEAERQYLALRQQAAVSEAKLRAELAAAITESSETDEPACEIVEPEPADPAQCRTVVVRPAFLSKRMRDILSSAGARAPAAGGNP